VYFPPTTISEAWTILTAAAVSTKKVLLGTCVTDPHRYHPAVLAQRLATIDQLSDRRVMLGLGAGMAMNLERFGIRWNKSVSRLAEAVKIMRRLWAGEKFSYDGEFWKFKNVFLQIKPIQSKVPIYFAANSPRMMIGCQCF
jgi:alkanesulfonate monooxygenase SsuD/methylene tetrahydromethanopterin reductase-like flavin-dependent oxidoreductase (luciferase family)